MPPRLSGASRSGVPLLLAAALAACAHTPPPPAFVRPESRIDVALPLPLPGPCTIPPPESFPAGGAEPRPIVQGGLEVVRVDGDARFSMGPELDLEWRTGRSDVAWTPDGTVMVTTSLQGVLVWDLVRGELRRAVPLALEHEARVEVNADATWAALSTYWRGESVVVFLRLDGTPGMHVRVGDKAAGFSPDGRSMDFPFRVQGMRMRRDLTTGTLTSLPEPSTSHALGQGTHALVQTGEGTWEVREEASGRTLQRFTSPRAPLVAAKAPRFALLGPEGLEVFDAPSGQRLQLLAAIPQTAGGQPPLLALSPDGDRVAVWRRETSAHVSGPDVTSLSVWNVTTGQRLWSQPLPYEERDDDAESTAMFWSLGRLEFSVDGRRVRVEAQRGPLEQLHDTETGELLAPLQGLSSAHHLAPDFRAVYLKGGLVALPGAPDHLRTARLAPVLARSTDGRWTASLDASRQVQLEGPQGCTALGVRLASEHDTVTFSPDGTHVYAVTSGFQHGHQNDPPRVYAWRTTPVEPLRVMGPTSEGTYGTAHVLPGPGQVMFSSAWGNEGWRVVDMHSGAEVRRGAHPPVYRGGPPAWSRGLCCRGCIYQAWNHRKPGDTPEGLGPAPIVSTRDGRSFFAPGDIQPTHPHAHLELLDEPPSPPLPFWDRDKVRRAQLLAHWKLETPGMVSQARLGAEMTTLALSPDERWVAAGLDNGDVVVNLTDTHESGRVTGLQTAVVALAFSGDGRRLVAADRDGDVVVTDHERGIEVGRLRLPVDHAVHLWLSPDGTELRVDTARGLRVSARLPPEVSPGP